MKSDVASYVGAVIREVDSREHEGRLARVVVATRTYDTTIEDVWDALTNAERIPRWFLPISGDLRLSGSYQLQGNAGGEITRCEPPRLFAVTWGRIGKVWMLPMVPFEHVIHVTGMRRLESIFKERERDR